MLKDRCFGYGPRDDSWHYVEDLPAENVRQHCVRHRLTMRRWVKYNYCRPPNFERSEQEHKHKGDENKSAKYGLTAFKDQITVHLRLHFWKHLSENRAVRELMNGGLPWLPFYG